MLALRLNRLAADAQDADSFSFSPVLVLISVLPDGQGKSLGRRRGHVLGTAPQ